MSKPASLVVDAARSDADLLDAPPVRWALEQLRRQGIELNSGGADGKIPAGALGAILSSPGSFAASARLASRNVAVPPVPGAFVVCGTPGAPDHQIELVAADATGASYGLAELGRHLVEGSLDELVCGPALVVAPETPVRAIGRAFTSAAHDLQWFQSQAFWTRYLDMLAEHRFNQLDLALGIAYDFPIHITDAYFLFAYPFFIDLAGSGVFVRGLSSDERDTNLAALKFVATESARRGIALHLGLWTHSYANAESPQANHAIEGLDAAHHAPYCRDALTVLLSECPEIRGITLRTHGESGVPEGSEQFWGTLFEAVKQTRPGGDFTIDLHAKGLTQSIIDLARAAGAHAVVSAKYSAEHLGLPYQQSSIRELDRLGRQTIASANGSSSARDSVRDTAQRLMGLSLHSRSGTRYSYGDLLNEDREHDVIYRIWPGTQKLLAWGDPLFAAAYAKASRFCGSLGIEVMEPLSFRGRRGSGLVGDTARSGYRDDVELPWTEDWEKYADTYEIWGRALFGPSTARASTALGPVASGEGAPSQPEVDGRRHVRAAIALSSRILPLVTSAHLPSAACVHYWPEIYTMAPISRKREETAANPYRGDTLAPARLGTVSAVDPAVFSSAREFAEAHLAARADGRYSPLDVADFLDDLAEGAASEAQSAREDLGLDAGDSLRLSDAEALAGLGRFFARLMRAAVAYELFELTNIGGHLAEAARLFEDAIANFAKLAADLDRLYVRDLAFGEVPEGRGAWSDRLPAMREELAQLQAELAELAPEAGNGPTPGLPEVLERRLVPLTGELTAVLSSSSPGGLEVCLELAPSDSAKEVAQATLCYRSVNQFATYEHCVMERTGPWRFRGVIPPEVLAKPYAVQYFCELAASDGRAARLPGLGPSLVEVPYRCYERRASR